MTDEPCRTATRYAVERARKEGAVLSFDPNLREPLWDSLETAREMIYYGMRHSDILKISDNEVRWFTGLEDLREGARQLLREYRPRLLLLTLGKEGSLAFTGDMEVYAPPFLQKGTIETTGAGDTFCASVLNFILEHDLDSLNGDELKEMLRFANAAAYLVTTKKGAIRSMPERAQVETILKEH